MRVLKQQKLFDSKNSRNSSYSAQPYTEITRTDWSTKHKRQHWNGCCIWTVSTHL